jgi:actin-related protein
VEKTLFSKISKKDCKNNKFNFRNGELSNMVDVKAKTRIFDHKDKSKKNYDVIKGMKIFIKDKENLEDNAIFKSEYEELGPSIFWKTT